MSDLFVSGQLIHSVLILLVLICLPHQLQYLLEDSKSCKVVQEHLFLFEQQILSYL